MQFARQVAHRVIFLDKGQVAKVGSPRQVITYPKSDRIRVLSRLNTVVN